MPPTKTIDDLRSAVVQRLRSLPVFPAKVAIIAEDRQNIATEVAKALGTGGGLVIIVYTGTARNIAPAAPIPQCETEIIIEIGEVPAINRGAAGTGVPGVEAARFCVRALHQFPWTEGRALTFTEQEYNRDAKGSVVQYFLTFKTQVSFDAEIGV